jgi:hypothetical protein
VMLVVGLALCIWEFLASSSLNPLLHFLMISAS